MIKNQKLFYQKRKIINEVVVLIEYYKNVIKSIMSKRRYEHSISVSFYAKELAKVYAADEAKAEIAGILHDITKEMPEQKQLEIIKKEGVVLSSLEDKTHKLWHSISGSIYIKNELGINDEDIINAVRYHTTARKNMSLLEKIIFIADFISDDREWENTKFLRALAFKNLDDAVIYGLKVTITALIDKDALIAEDTLNAYNDLMMKKFK